MLKWSRHSFKQIHKSFRLFVFQGYKNFWFADNSDQIGATSNSWVLLRCVAQLLTLSVIQFLFVPTLNLNEKKYNCLPPIAVMSDDDGYYYENKSETFPWLQPDSGEHHRVTRWLWLTTKWYKYRNPGFYNCSGKNIIARVFMAPSDWANNITLHQARRELRSRNTNFNAIRLMDWPE